MTRWAWSELSLAVWADAPKTPEVWFGSRKALQADLRKKLCGRGFVLKIVGTAERPLVQTCTPWRPTLRQLQLGLVALTCTDCGHTFEPDTLRGQPPSRCQHCQYEHRRTYFRARKQTVGAS